MTSATTSPAHVAGGESAAVLRTNRRIALVCSRFGADVAGGAEAMLAELGQGLRKRGWEVDVLASTARDLYSMAHELPEGETLEGGLRVMRFKLLNTRRREHDRLDRLITLGAGVNLPEQYWWMNTSARVPGIYHFLLDHAEDYRAIAFSPYRAWTTFACSEIAAERSILIPCLHDEPHAQLELFRHTFRGSRALWFQTQPEMELAERIFELPARRAVIGSGIHAPHQYDPEGFKARHGIQGEFVLYAGRREWGKGWIDLVSNLEFANTMLPAPVSLVTCGVGAIGKQPKNYRIIDLGYVSDQERSDAMAAATVYVQPSSMESFSRTINEAWLAGTPVLANAASPVVKRHCEQSGAGLMHRDRFEFAESLKLLLERPDLRREMSHRGREYVLRNNSWEAVLDRVERSIEEWM